MKFMEHTISDCSYKLLSALSPVLLSLAVFLPSLHYPYLLLYGVASEY
jgi:hypothetical protein